MPSFEYVALSRDRKPKKGLIEADSERHARQLLREQGLIPSRIQTLGEAKARGGSNRTAGRASGKKSRAGVSFSFLQPKLTAKDLVMVTRQLANLTRASLPLDEALKMIAAHNSVAIRKVITETRDRVLEGNPLNQALKEQGVFNEEYTATIAAGERSGELAFVLEKMADDLERRHALMGKVRSAMVYPVTIALVSVSVVIALLTYVVPQVVEVFASTNRALPPLTVMMIDISNFLRANGSTLLVLLLALFIGFRWLLRYDTFKRRWHITLGNMPFFGKVFLGSNNAQFARNLSLLHLSGVPIVDALRISSQTLSSLPMQEAVSAASDMVREGSSIFRSLEKHDALPAMTLYMLASGEASGQLSMMLERAALNQEQELEQFTSALLSLLEPLIILVMGGVVLLIVLSILLPIFEFNQML